MLLRRCHEHGTLWCERRHAAVSKVPGRGAARRAWTRRRWRCRAPGGAELQALRGSRATLPPPMLEPPPQPPLLLPLPCAPRCLPVNSRSCAACLCAQADNIHLQEAGRSHRARPACADLLPAWQHRHAWASCRATLVLCAETPRART